MSWDYYGGYGGYTYTSVADLKSKAKKIIEKAEKSGKKMNPVEIQGRTIAKSWWGKAWCENLESYADYYSRLERGRKYVRANCVVDLQIESGEVYAQVIGSRSTPYKIHITIDELSDEQYEFICKKCSSKIQNIDSLIKGDFPDNLKELFLQKKNGLFPAMAEIHFDCSCPDWADMCKHVAATLYGIGARFDKDPLLFFKLRGVDTEKLIGKAIQNKIEMMLENANAQSDRLLADDKVSALFGL